MSATSLTITKSSTAWFITNNLTGLIIAGAPFNVTTAVLKGANTVTITSGDNNLITFDIVNILGLAGATVNDKFTDLLNTYLSTSTTVPVIPPANALRRSVNPTGNPFYPSPPDLPATAFPPVAGTNLVNFFTDLTIFPEDFINDPGSQLDFSSPTRITFNQGGVYQIDGALYVYGPAQGFGVLVGVQINGEVVLQTSSLCENVGYGETLQNASPAAWVATTILSTLVEVKAGDYIEIQYYGFAPSSFTTPYDLWLFPSGFMAVSKQSAGATGPAGTAGTAGATGAAGVVQTVQDQVTGHTSLLYQEGPAQATILTKQLAAGTNMSIADDGMGTLTLASSNPGGLVQSVQDHVTGNTSLLYISGPSQPVIETKQLLAGGGMAIADDGFGTLTLTATGGVSVDVGNTFVGDQVMVVSPGTANPLVKRLTAGTGVTLTADGSQVTINSTGGGGVVVGDTSSGTFPMVKNPYTLAPDILRLTAGTNVVMTTDGNQVIINSTAGAGANSYIILANTTDSLVDGVNAPFSTANWLVVSSNNMSYDSTTGNIFFTLTPRLCQINFNYSIISTTTSANPSSYINLSGIHFGALLGNVMSRQGQPSTTAFINEFETNFSFMTIPEYGSNPEFNIAAMAFDFIGGYPIFGTHYIYIKTY